MKNFLCLAGVMLLTVWVVAAQNVDRPRYTKTPSGYLMVLRQSDDVFKEIEKMVVAEQIPSASLTGMGFVHARFGFFDFKTKEYKPRDFKDVEMASMTGSVAWQDGKVSLHLHGVVTGDNFQAFGGHLLAATVGTGSLEVMVVLHDRKLERKMEQPLGANVLQL